MTFLWIHRGPGKGKTMLSLFLTEEVEQLAQDKEGTRVLFYFRSHDDEQRNSATGILRT